MAATDWLSQGTLVLASNNKGKIAEFEKLFAELQLPVEVVAQGKLNIEDAIEDGLSFVENAIIKARHASKISGNLLLQMIQAFVCQFLAALPAFTRLVIPVSMATMPPIMKNCWPISNPYAKMVK